MKVVNLPHVDNVGLEIKVTPMERGYQVSTHEDMQIGCIVCELDAHNSRTLASDIQDLICQCMRAGYRQCQRDMRLQLGLEK